MEIANFHLLLWFLQKISQVVCGWRHTLALSEKKNVFSWGRGTSGQLGNGEIVDRWFPYSALAQYLIFFYEETQCLIFAVYALPTYNNLSTCTILKEHACAD